MLAHLKKGHKPSSHWLLLLTLHILFTLCWLGALKYQIQILMIYSQRNQYKLKRIQWINVARREEKKKPHNPILGDEIETNPSSFHIQTQIQIFIVIQIQLFLCTFVLLHCYKYCFYPFYPSNLMKTHKKLLPHFSHWDSYQELLTQQNPKWDPWEPMWADEYPWRQAKTWQCSRL